jgi:hypothetical protein
MFMAVTDTAAVSVQLSVSPESNIAVSLVPGTEAPFELPEEVDQLSVVFQAAPLAPTQYRSAAYVELLTNATSINRACMTAFLIISLPN